MQPIVIVSYSSLEQVFINVLLNECKLFAKRIVVTYGTRMYTGADEDIESIRQLDQRHACEDNLVRFVSYPVRLDELDDPVRLHNMSRAVGVAAAQLDEEEKGDWLLFLDADEVPEASVVREFLASRDFTTSRDCAFKLANFWYFMLPTLRAKQIEDSIVLVHSSWVTGDDTQALWHPRERDGILLFNMQRHPYRHVQRQVYSTDLHKAPNPRPMFHHFSWVRSLPNLISKVRGWGHRNQRNWEHLLRETWADLAQGRLPVNDFVHGYELEVVPPTFASISNIEFGARVDMSHSL